MTVAEASVEAATGTGSGSETVANIAEYSNWRQTDGRTDPAHLAHSVSCMRGEQEVLGEHFNAMSINYVVDFQRHTHTYINTQPETCCVVVFACRI